LGEDPGVGYSPRKSYIKKRGGTVINKRKLKSCGICGRSVKQLPRHIKSVHKDVDQTVRHAEL